MELQVAKRHDHYTESMSPGPLPYGDKGGGGSLPPHGEDYFNRIVNVHWRKRRVAAVGGIFASGDVCCYIRASTGGFNWQPLGPEAFTSRGSITGGAYAKSGGRPTFLLCGEDGGIEGGGSETIQGMIMESNDGFSWRTIFAQVGTLVQSVVWDPAIGMFTATIQATGEGSGTWTEQFGSWVGRPEDISPYSDGITGFNPETGQTIGPEQVPVIDARCVAFAGGIWVAGGSLEHVNSATAASLDGENWVVVSQGSLGMTDSDGNDADFAITAIIGAPISDFALTHRPLG
jgi:hypothetical protein